MSFIENLKQEHVEIERELLELETIKNSEKINYSNLIHVFKNLIKVWDVHEAKEEDIFPFLENQEIKIPVETMMFEHRALKPHKNAVKKAISSGSEVEVKKALNIDVPIIISKLRKHIDDEDEILYRIVLKELDVEEIKEIGVKLIKNYGK